MQMIKDMMNQVLFQVAFCEEFSGSTITEPR